MVSINIQPFFGQVLMNKYIYKKKLNMWQLTQRFMKNTLVLRTHLNFFGQNLPSNLLVRLYFGHLFSQKATAKNMIGILEY